MDDMKDKMKGFMNKLSSSSSGKFKGQGRVLGSSSSGPANSNLTRPTPPYLNPNQNPKPKPKPNPPPPSSSPSPSSSSSSNQNKPSFVTQNKPSDKSLGSVNNSDPNRKPANGFDPYDALITNGKRSQHGYSLQMFECPICGHPFKTEEEVSIHVESCINNCNDNNNNKSIDNIRVAVDDDAVAVNNHESGNELESCVAAFLSGNPKEGSTTVVLTLFRNICREPENAKFRRIRMSNPKIREAIGEVAGGVELLEFVGFKLQEEGGEMWAVMEVPNEDMIGLIKKVIEFLEPRKVQDPQKVENLKDESASENEQDAEPKKFDRQIRVFFSVPESVAAKIELPDSFFKLSVTEVKREAEMRKKKFDESQLLIPRSFKEKQAKAARKKYTKTVIRIQFPDGVVLQGIFRPWEKTTVLYEFVSAALKEPSLEFELLNPGMMKRRVIPHFPAAGQKATTLDEEDLIPSALIKFKPIETDSVVFTGLSNELLQISEPLV